MWTLPTRRALHLQDAKAPCGAMVTMLRRFTVGQRSRSGLAAVEFALLAPILAAIVIGVSQVSEIAVGTSYMQTAVRASIQYALNGGTDLATAQAVGLTAWNYKPANATLEASTFCTCQGTTAACTQTCSDGSIPEEYMSVRASGLFGGTVYDQNKTLTEEARIR